MQRSIRVSKHFPVHSVELRALLGPVSIAQRPWQPAPKQPRNVVLSRRRDFLTTAAALRSASVVTAPVESQSVAPPAMPASRSPVRPAAPPSPPWWQDWTVAFRQPAWRFAFVAVLLLILALGFGRTAVTLASDALPGDALYPVKRLTERTRMVLTVDPPRAGQVGGGSGSGALDGSRAGSCARPPGARRYSGCD